MPNNSTYKIKQVALTTTDNPFDPFDEFDKWFAFDEAKGYHTCSYLDRIARISDDWSFADQVDELERAIDEICALNLTGNYKKLVRE